MRLTRIVLLAFVASACSSTRPPVTPVAAPSPAPAPSGIAAPAAAQASPALEAAPAPAATRAPGDRAKAQALVDEGRRVQRERGEDGALDAAKLYEQALAADWSLGAAYWELGWSRQIAGDLAGAVKAWDELRAVEPAFPDLDKHYPVLVMRRDQRAALDALPEPGKLPEPEATPRPGPSITLAAVGDVQMGRGWPAERAALPPDDARDFFKGVAEQLRAADVTFGNLETALADEGESEKCAPKSTKCFAFRAPTAYAKALVDAGFDVMSVANNHAGDFGEAGRQSTMRALDSVGIRYSGPVGVIGSWETQGLKLALIAFSTGGGVYRIQELELARKVVAETDRTHDLVIVSFHGGAEGTSAAHVPKATETFFGENRGDVHAFAHTVIDAGADLVLGHGPHLWRAMELYKGRLIAYSMGNFASWETFNLTGPLAVSGILYAKLAPNGVLLETRVEPTVLVKPGPPELDPKRQVIEHVRKLGKQDFGSELLSADGSYVRPADASASATRAAP